MRLARPIYESMPSLYAGIGVARLVIALTVFLRRQDYRAKSREYAHLSDFPSVPLPRR